MVCARSSGICLLDATVQACLLYLHLYTPIGRLIHVTAEPEAHPHAAAASFERTSHPFEWAAVLRQRTSHPRLAGNVQQEACIHSSKRSSNNHLTKRLLPCSSAYEVLIPEGQAVHYAAGTVALA